MEEALVYAVAVAFSPVPIAASALVLTGSRAVANGTSLAVGWTVGLGLTVVTVVLLVGSVGIGDSDPAWIAVLELVVGAAFVAAALLIVVRRDRSRRQRTSWLDAVDGVGPLGAAGMGAVLACANPKVLALSLGAALALSESNAGTGTTAGTIVLFAAVGAVGVVLLPALYAAFPERAGASLTSIRGWLVRHEATVLAILGLAIGSIFMRDALTSL